MPTNGARKLFWVVFALAFALRAAHILFMRDNPLFAHPIMDAGIHDSWARGLLAGTWPPSEPFFRAPLYPYLLGGLYFLLGAARLPVQLVHALISALGPALAALIASRIFSRRAGWAAGILFACAWTSIYFAGELLIVTVTTTLNLLALWLLLDRPADRRPGMGRLFLVGLVLGLSAIARPNILIVLPAVVWYLWRVGPAPLRPRPWLVLAAGLILPILPVTAHNFFKGGDTVLIASQGGVNFYIGNNSRADGITAIVPGTRGTWQGGFEDAIALAEEEEGRDLKPSEVDRHYFRKGLSFWRDDPGGAVRLYGKKLWLLLAAGERSNNKFIYCWRDWSPLLKLPVWPGWALVLTLAIVGFMRRDQAAASRGLLLGFAGLYLVSILFFFVNARFRLPVLAVLTIPAGVGVAAILEAIACRSWRKVPVAGLIIAVVVGSMSATDYISFLENKAELNPYHHYTLANAWATKGDSEEAIREFRETLRIQAAHPQRKFDLIAETVYSSLGDMLIDAGRQDQAMEVFSEWVRQNPRTLDGRLRLGDILLQLGRVDAAAVQFEIALREAPEDPRAKLGYAWIQYYNGNIGAALRAFRGLGDAGGDPQAIFGQGLCLISLDRLGAAEKVFKRLLALEPEYWQAIGNLAGIYERSGRLAEARLQYQKLLELHPEDEKARNWLAANPPGDQGW